MPTGDELTEIAKAPQAQSQRAAEEARIRDLIDRLGRVEGLKPVLTLLDDTCERHNQNLLESRTQVLLSCKMRAIADFSVRGVALITSCGFWHRSWGAVAERHPGVRL
ncbi:MULTISPECIES: hypothetical protein [Kitasatospora]|uniref:Uncharacterized protein n=1 Tax=Kitasatospora cathayae TaxID=3004092 RepID=A0ABY7PX90_9ACTN|nr:hypothetical protein [Kitasatospora sp. HUAS 3-15]WBP84576.1 hypothetical protein O1G21_01010 [Kitasatospora sp. HUAS 3-15]